MTASFDGVTGRDVVQVLQRLEMVRRIAEAVPSLLIVSFLAVLLLSLAPGDPLTSRLDRDALIRMLDETLARVK